MGKTVKKYSQEELLRYHPWENLQRYKQDIKVDQRRKLAWKVARSASKILKEKYGATEVFLFGSLAKETRFTPWSDIDLSVSGLPPNNYYKAAGEILDMGMAEGIKIDVLDPADCPKAIRKRIRDEGIEL